MFELSCSLPTKFGPNGRHRRHPRYPDRQAKASRHLPQLSNTFSSNGKSMTMSVNSYFSPPAALEDSANSSMAPSSRAPVGDRMLSEGFHRSVGGGGREGLTSQMRRRSKRLRGYDEGMMGGIADFWFTDSSSGTVLPPTTSTKATNVSQSHRCSALSLVR